MEGWKEIRQQEDTHVFQPKCITIADPGWVATGPGPDPKVLLESQIILNNAKFRMLAFRVPMPYSAGWSKRAAWEDDKGLQNDGLLWNVPEFIKTVQDIDNGNAVTEDETIMMDHAMVELSDAWDRITRLLGWTGKEWKPAIIEGQPYIIIGIANGHAEDVEGLKLNPSESRSWVGKSQRLISFNLNISGATCGLSAIEIRHLDDAGKHYLRAIDPKDEVWLTGMSRVASTIPGGSPNLSPFTIEGRQYAGLIAPVSAEIWSFDYSQFLNSLWPGLRPGYARWTIEHPLEKIDSLTAQMVEAAADAIRERRVTQHEGEVCLACSSAQALQYFKSEDWTTLGNDVFMHLGRLIMRGLGQRADGGNYFHTGRIVTRIYVFPDAIYLTLSNAFSRLAEAATSGVMLRLTEGNIFFETSQDGNPDQPLPWIDNVPTVADGRIKRFVKELSED